MRLLFILVATLLSNTIYANMASPYQPGIFVSNPFTSKNVDVLHESIYVKIDKDFSKAFYRIEYTIYTETGGSQIPLLFYAMDFNKGFKVLVDGKEVKINLLQEQYFSSTDSAQREFAKSYNMPPEKDGSIMTVSWNKNYTQNCQIKDLHYFEADLGKGKHTIRIEYESHDWGDQSGWIKNSSFRYSLAPAKFWKSFGTLSISVDASEVTETISTNLGKPLTGSLNKIATWEFTSLPADDFIITHEIPISKTGLFLLNMGPEEMSFIFALIVLVVHLFFTGRYRKKNPEKKRNPFVLAGSFIAVILLFIFYLQSYSIIDDALGKAASNFHGYTFLSIIFYPIVFLIYLLIIWLADKLFKKGFSKV